MGSDPNAKDNNGQTPLHIAILQIDYEMAALLINSPFTKLKIKDNEGNTPSDLTFIATNAMNVDREAFLRNTRNKYPPISMKTFPGGKSKSNFYESINIPDTPDTPQYVLGVIVNNMLGKPFRDLLKQPQIEHNASKKNPYQVVTKELSEPSETEMKQDKRETALAALAVVLNKQFGVLLPDEKPNQKPPKNQQSDKRPKRPSIG